MLKIKSIKTKQQQTKQTCKENEILWFKLYILLNAPNVFLLLIPCLNPMLSPQGFHKAQS